MSFPTYSAPCFTWHLPTDRLIFCSPALLLLGLAPETAPQTMTAFLDRLPEPQRRSLQRQRQMVLAGKSPGCQTCSYACNGRRVREALHVIRCGADGRPRTVLATIDLLDNISLSMGDDAGYWTYARKEGDLLLAMDACSDGLWDWDATTGKVYYSQNYLAMLGHTSETFPPELESWTRAVHPDDYEKTVTMQMRVAASPAEGDSFACTYRIRKADGSWLWVLGRGCVTSRDSRGHALRIVGMHTDISSLQHDRNVLEEKIRVDSLTGVYNRYHLDGLLQQLRLRRGPLCILMADVNGLKMINDHLGHHAGDELLRTAAQQLSRHIRQEDCLARLGGDEFVLVLSCPGSVVRKRLAIIRKALEAWNAGGGLPLELAFGLADSDDGSVPPDVLLRQADARMMEEKKQVRAASHARIRAWLEDRTGRKVSGDDPRL